MSPEDRRSRAIRVLDDYLAMGIPNLWLFDPIDRTVFLYDEMGLKLVETSRIAIPGQPIYLDLPELFATLD